MSGSDEEQIAPLCSKMSTQFSIHEDENPTDAKTSKGSGSGPKHGTTPSADSIPLVSSKLGNLQTAPSRSASASKDLKQEPNEASQAKEDDGQVSMSSLIARLSEQQALLDKQKNALASGDQATGRGDSSDSTTGSTLMTPATDAFSTTPATDTSDEDKVQQQQSTDELDRLKLELEEARNRLACQERELTKNRAMQSTFEHLKPGSMNAGPKVEPVDRSMGFVAENFAGNRQPIPCSSQDDAKSDVSDFSHAGSLARGQATWMGGPSAGLSSNSSNPTNVWNQGNGRSWLNRPMAPNLPPLMVPQLQQQPQLRAFSGPSSPTSNSGGRFVNEFGQINNAQCNRRQTQNNRSGQSLFSNRSQGWDGYGNGEISPIMGVNPQYQPMGMFQASIGYQPRPIGTPLSPTAAEFTGLNPPGPWNSTPASPGQTYVSPMEPLNYRRLLDRSVTCNWKYIVDKIVCNNDQQASIFLQQKLKVGTVEQKYEIVEAIVAQAYPLMVNRFGNFLVQRCFEHGTPEQVVAIANAIRGNTLSLSMDAFGCHVVQKAFDAVPEEYKAIMVHELLRRIPETVIHRYACHVWQKLFELRWSDSPPQIMKYVNEALRGMWHEVALGETGSLVVQNIFENCLEEDKRPCINEVLNSIDIVAHGQFGNWCIQHICEHGAPADRSRAIDHVLRYATEYSMDQFASKVVEKCLKIGGADFLERYLERVCEGRPDRPRIPLIDISSDQYGNYLIQYILTHANAQHREIVASHIRKHMVSLRGSKFGSRVGMLCSNPAYATRPGPGAGPSTNRFNNNSGTSTRFGGQFR